MGIYRLLHINNDIVMLDRGEGSAGQLDQQAYYMSTPIEQYFQRFKAIFISHMNLDHYLGFHNVLAL